MTLSEARTVINKGDNFEQLANALAIAVKCMEIVDEGMHDGSMQSSPKLWHELITLMRGAGDANGLS